MDQSDVERRSQLMDSYPYMSVVGVDPADECAIVAFVTNHPDLWLLGTRVLTQDEWIVAVGCKSPEARSKFECWAM